MDPKLYTNLLDPIWVLFGSLMDQFWPIFVFLDHCWIIAGHFPIVPYSPCGVGGMAKPIVYGTHLLGFLTLRSRCISCQSTVHYESIPIPNSSIDPPSIVLVNSQLPIGPRGQWAQWAHGAMWSLDVQSMGPLFSTELTQNWSKIGPKLVQRWSIRFLEPFGFIWTGFQPKRSHGDPKQPKFQFWETKSGCRLDIFCPICWKLQYYESKL